MVKEKGECSECHQFRYMTRHHVKNSKGIKTGEIQKMCRECHNEWEEYYRLYGMIIHPKKLKKQDYQERVVFYPSQNPIIPFYAVKNNN